MTQIIQEEFGSVDCIAGVATAGIPQGALVAQELGLPFIYVRSKPKDHGTGILIEGEVMRGQRVVVIDDIISTGKSSLQAVQALKDAGCTVAGLAAIFSYGFDQATENFKDAKCKFFTLSNYNALLKYAHDNNYISASESDVLSKWRVSPSTWGQN